MSSWDNDSIGCLVELIVGVIGIVILIFVCMGKDETGTLYMMDSKDPVCYGTLHTSHHPYANDEYTFTCKDGRVFKNLTNYMLRN